MANVTLLAMPSPNRGRERSHRGAARPYHGRLCHGLYISQLAYYPEWEEPILKPVLWVPRTYDDLVAFPRDAQHSIGLAFMMAQAGGKHPSAKPLKGFKGAGVLEIVDDHDGDAYRTIYTVRFSGAVYVLHVFQKKSKKGTQTPKHVIDLVKARLKTAALDYRKRGWQNERTNEGDASGRKYLRGPGVRGWRKAQGQG